MTICVHLDPPLPPFSLERNFTEPFMRWWRLWAEFADQPQDRGEQLYRNSNIGHLKGDVAAMLTILRRRQDTTRL